MCDVLVVTVDEGLGQKKVYIWNWRIQHHHVRSTELFEVRVVELTINARKN